MTASSETPDKGISSAGTGRNKERAVAPEPIDQFGVLPYRPREDGELEILLVTSRETGRWVIPKGNPMPRLTSRETAQSEAYEEGGVEGHIGQAPIGHFIYDKTRSSGRVVKAKVSVFPLEVTREHKDWPEKSQRRRQWFDREEAATNVGEPELQALIRRFHPPPGYPDGPGIDMGKLRIGRGFGMVNVIRAIMPREDRFFDMFARHADLVVAGADAMVAMFSGEQPIAESCQQIEAHEDQADDVTRDVLVAVRRSFITPFDRSAITALTSAMDDALDEMWQTAKAITLYEVKDFEPQMLEMSRYAAEGARLRSACGKLS